MAHFAEINNENIVTRVIVLSNDYEDEILGEQFCKELTGSTNRWVKTSYNNKIRGTFASPGMTYDEVNDVFVTIPLDPELEKLKIIPE